MSPWIAKVQPKGVPVTQVIICGGRDFRDGELLFRKMNKLTYWFDLVEVVIGGMGRRVERGGEWVWEGADYWGNQWAERNWMIRHIWHPDWKGLGKRAGPHRNREMARSVQDGGHCVAFWNGRSPGTANMIQEFKQYNNPKHLKIVRY